MQSATPSLSKWKENHRRQEPLVTSEPTRDALSDPLLTPENSALIIIDYQPRQLQGVQSIEHELLLRNIISVARLAKAYNVPIVLATINVVARNEPPTLPDLKEVLADDVELDRTQMNAWEDVEFRQAVVATGRKKLVMTALLTEVCLAFPSLDALREDYEVFPVVDAVGGISRESHRAGLERLLQAGAQPISSVSLACEWQRDWARVETVSPNLHLLLASSVGGI
jgi:nicotinamidase-related amidase